MNNAFSLPKLQRLCDRAYKKNAVLEHIEITNNFDWYAFMEPFVLPKSHYVGGITKVCLFNSLFTCIAGCFVVFVFFYNLLIMYFFFFKAFLIFFCFCF